MSTDSATIVRHSGAAVLMAALALACGSESTGTAPVASLQVNAPATVLLLGETLQLTATARDANGAVLPNAKITWSVIPASIAAITQGGVLSGTNEGLATVMASSGMVTASRQIEITAEGASTRDVFTPGLVFSPTPVIIPLGGTVRFNITGVAHNVEFNRTVAGAPADIPVVENQTFLRVFNTAGTFPYDCTVHPGMSGEVIVLPPAP